MPRDAPAKQWCFTLNNYTPAELTAIVDSAGNFDYLCFGRERGNNNTPHLQGYLILKEKKRFSYVRQLAGLERAHWEKKSPRSTPKQASDYCKKDGDYDEYGELPTKKQGQRTDFDELKEWIKEQDHRPTDREVAEEFPSLWGRYRSACISFLDLFSPHPTLVQGTLRPWQEDLNTRLSAPPNDRDVMFVVDENGNSGKSWFIRYLMTERPDDVQMLSIGKRDDLAHAIDPAKKIFFFDVPRGGMEFMQYAVLEQLKNRLVFSPKYESRMKVLHHIPHVVVFCNEEPDRTKLSRDRFRVTHIRQV
ncbi:putative replication initiation protein [Hermit crab associated circular virus]|uniref:Putative replication initiation protein n=1 Tax=Hermit crab associated circular virus TaxID=1692252 RepID=A0A0K1RL35_9CIRC|nr:putative replication initiation protein [Hermit crab associated circular virus]AKV62276.1 putative replication initiation protein [Hermit crab associated circular virus]AKV62278.1 putative replication initiation protein [Hermit crab associated circular virus]